jgi:hypothetical protein
MKTLLYLVVNAWLAFTVGGVALAQHYTQTDLVSNKSGVAPVTDPNLVNPGGLSRGSGGAWWVADNSHRLLQPC